MKRTNSQRRSLQDFKEHIRIPQVLEALGRSDSFRSTGSRCVGPCPIHSGDNPRSFVIDLDRDFWFCWTRCREGGDVIDLAYKLHNRSWPETFRFLERIIDRHVVDQFSTPAPNHKRSGQSPLEFKPFTRRLSLDPHHPFFRRMGLTIPTLRTFEAGAWHGHGVLTGTVAVRIFDLQGQPLGYAGRRLQQDEIDIRGKWWWPTGCPKRELLFGWHRARPHLDRGLILVESPWSVLKLHQVGYPNAVALCGTAVSPVQQTLFQRVPRLALFLDGDPAGQQATQAHVRAKIHPRVHPIACPDGLDPADLAEPQIKALLSQN